MWLKPDPESVSNMFDSKKPEYVNMSQVVMHKYFTLGTVKSSLTKFLLPKIVKLKMLHLLSVSKTKTFPSMHQFYLLSNLHYSVNKHTLLVLHCLDVSLKYTVM